MITVTKAAAEQIMSGAQGDNAGMALRVAIVKTDESGLDYRMGFDEVTENDLTFDSEGVTVVIKNEYDLVLSGSTIDFVQIEQGKSQFTIMNPNDPNHSGPTE